MPPSPPRLAPRPALLAPLALGAALAALGAAGCRRTPPGGSGGGRPDASAAAPAPAVTVLRGVRLIDGLGGPPVEGASLVIEGPVVRAAGVGVEAPAGATVIEMRGATVLPGLIDDHAHVGLVDDARSGPELDTRASVLRELAQFEAYGVTTVTSLGMNGSVFHELQPGLHAGTLAGADLFGADRGLGVPAAAPPVKADAEHLDRPATAEQAREMVRAAAGRHPTLIKIWVDDFHGSLPVKMSPEVYRAVLDEAHRHRLRVAAHVYYLDDARALVDAGVDVLAHGVRDRPVDDAFLAALKAHRTWTIATLALDEASFVYAERPPWVQTPFVRQAIGPVLAAQLDDPHWRDRVLGDAPRLAQDRASLATNQANLRRLHDAGALVGFGTDAGAQPLRIPGVAEHRELALMVQAGLTPMQAITIATRRAAELLGLDDRGVLAPGKLADLVVVDGRPDERIDEIGRIRAVWHRGRPARGPLATFRR